MNHYTPEKSEVAPSESMLRFSLLSAVPIDASDSRVSSSDARGSRASISKVNSSLKRQPLVGTGVPKCFHIKERYIDSHLVKDPI